MNDSAIVKPEDLAATLKDKVESKIRDAFVDLITDEQWSQMTKAALKDFTTDVHDRGTTRRSPFKQIVHDIVKEKMLERLKDELAKPEYFGGHEWHGNMETLKPSDYAKNVIRELMPELIQALFGTIIQGAVNNIRSQLQSGNGMIF
jgi:hypothetical protein